MVFAFASLGLAAAVALITALRWADLRWRFFACLFAGLAAGAWLFHFTHVAGFWVAPPVILLLYLTPLRRIRYVSAALGGIALGVLIGELWSMFREILSPAFGG